MKDQSHLIESIRNRIKKRYQHLSKWAHRNKIDYYRLFDRDIPNCPIMVDSLPDHWLIWICNHSRSEAEITALVDQISAVLIELKTARVIIKNRQKNMPIKQVFNQKDVMITIQENGCRFELNLTRYLDVGLFIDHRKTRQWLAKKAKGKRVLNLYAYTGSFGVYALKNGATFVTSVDLNPGYNEWQQRNYELNGLSLDKVSIIASDVFQFLSRHRGRYDIIVCDPPSFSESKRKGARAFQIQDDASSLLLACWDRLKPGGELVFSTNYKKFKFEAVHLPKPSNVECLTEKLCPKDFIGKWRSQCWSIKKMDEV